MNKEEKNISILKALDEAITDGPWDKSNFLRAVGKKLAVIKENFVVNTKDKNKNNAKEQDVQISTLDIGSKQKEIFISLYASEGSNLKVWERILANLPKQIVSRAIYEKEEDIKKLIKSKIQKINEAYIAIYINQEDLLTLSADKIPKDKFGVNLLVLKNQTLNLENICKFVHESGVYRYIKGQLLKISEK